MEIPLGRDSGEGAKMWAPKMEARVLQELNVERSDRVLEVGTGSGYFAALLAHRAAQVYSVELNPELAAFGKANIARHGIDNITLEVADGGRGYGKWGPYDVVVLTGSVPIVPRVVLDMLAPGGRLFAVVGEAPVMTARLLTCTAPGAWRSDDLFETLLAPLAHCEQPSRFTF